MSDAPNGSDEDGGEVDLGVSLETVATVIDHIRAIQEGEEPDEFDTDDEADEIEEEDLDEETLAAFIDELNEDEQAALVALAWIGRGDYEAEDWAEALRLARERGTAGDTSSYLLGMDMAGDLLAEGLAAFGLPVEDIER